MAYFQATVVVVVDIVFLFVFLPLQLYLQFQSKDLKKKIFRWYHTEIATFNIHLTMQLKRSNSMKLNPQILHFNSM